jgi:hypothetical protein
MQNQNEEWGAEIPIVDGVWPVWLGGNDLIMWSKPRQDDPSSMRNGGPCRAADHNWGRYIHSPSVPTETAAIRLPATHWAYLPLSRGFTPWAGGDEAPGDWDGGEVLLRDGDTYNGDKHPKTWAHWWGGADIIGYRRRGEASDDASMHASDPDTVTIRRMTEAEAYGLALQTPQSPDDNGDHISGWIAALRAVGLIRPEPTQAQRIASTTGLALADVERVIDLYLKSEGKA